MLYFLPSVLSFQLILSKKSNLNQNILEDNVSSNTNIILFIVYFFFSFCFRDPEGVWTWQISSKTPSASQ